VLSALTPSSRVRALGQNDSELGQLRIALGRFKDLTEARRWMRAGWLSAPGRTGW
jgi:hypothetical protein